MFLWEYGLFYPKKKIKRKELLKQVPIGNEEMPKGKQRSSNLKTCWEELLEIHTNKHRILQALLETICSNMHLHFSGEKHIIG